jgi:hypothetical protein
MQLFPSPQAAAQLKKGPQAAAARTVNVFSVQFHHQAYSFMQHFFLICAASACNNQENTNKLAVFTRLTCLKFITSLILSELYD